MRAANLMLNNTHFTLVLLVQDFLLGVVNHEVYVADTVQVEVWRKLVRDYCRSRLDELLY